MIQDARFAVGEGDNWFKRNRDYLGRLGKIDWPIHLLERFDRRGTIGSVVELGCSNGFRLARIKREILPHARCVGIDASREAIGDGAALYPELELHQGVLASPPVEGSFDLVIVNYVLHWVDRSTLSRSICAIDGLVRDGGLLILGDFQPDYPQRRRYHHLPDDELFTYKQDYPALFTTLGLYKEVARLTYDHDSADATDGSLALAASSSRGVCALLHKSLNAFYPEVS
jgi:SAM-dependent methyltransferase